MSRTALKELFLLLIGGGAYYAIEVIYRGYSHWTMALLGGAMFVLIGGLNEYLPWEMGFLQQCAIGAAAITAAELCSGCILNLWLGLDIWDYSGLPCNLLGQICLPFTAVWFGLSGVAIVLDDWLRYLLFREERPHYKLI